MRRRAAAPAVRRQPAAQAPAAQPRQRARAFGAQPLARTRPSARPHATHPGGATAASSSASRLHAADRRATGLQRISTRSSQSCAVFATNLLGAAVPVDAGWTFAPIVLLALVAYAAIYMLALAHLARRGRRARRAGRQARALAHGHLLPVPRADLADRPPRRAARVRAHGPAPADRRPRPDLPDAGADQAHPASRHAPDPAARARGGAVRASGVRRRRLRRRDVALARPVLLRGAR